jgi:tRNA (cytidine/uridine-2'-O-)-methyltransferase
MMPMLEVVLVEPQIATNTGNIIRLCANVGARLHLVGPLGFDMDGASLRRGGLDYHELTDTQFWTTWEDCRAALGDERRWFATTTRVPHRRYDEVAYRSGDVVVFGC